MKKLTVGEVLVGLALLPVCVVGVAYGATAHRDRATQPCANNATGVLRAVPHCAKGEHRVDIGAPPGVSGYQVVSAVIPMGTAGPNSISIECPPGLKVLGGGSNLLAVVGPRYDNGERDRIVGSAPLADGAGWGVDLVLAQAPASTTIYAICATVAP